MKHEVRIAKYWNKNHTLKMPPHSLNIPCLQYTPIVEINQQMETC